MTRHFSNSALSDYQRCGKLYELKRIKKIPEPPSWWFIGGKAVHAATEELDKATTWIDGDLIDLWLHHLDDEVRAEEERWPDYDTWTKIGKQDYAYWETLGLEYVKRWIQFKRDSKWRVVSVELDVSRTLPNGDEVKAYIDRVFVDSNGTSWVLDIKTGSKQPESPQQLGIYAALYYELIAQEGYAEVRAGYWMAKDNRFVEKDVSHYTLDTVQKLGENLYRGLDAKVFLPVVSNACFVCPVKDACYAHSGDTELSRRHDSLNPNFLEEE